METIQKIIKTISDKKLDIDLSQNNISVLNAQQSNGDTALMCAADRGHVEIVQSLVGAGAKLDLQSINGRTALQYANDKNNQSIVAVLVNAERQLHALGASLNKLEAAGFTVDPV